MKQPQIARAIEAARKRVRSFGAGIVGELKSRHECGIEIVLVVEVLSTIGFAFPHLFDPD
jgi:hypothetical protein